MAPNVPNQSISPLDELAAVVERYDSKVRLLFQLKNYISLVKYDPEIAKLDKTSEFRRFVTSNKLDLWETLLTRADTRKTKKRIASVRKGVEMLQNRLQEAPMASKVSPSSSLKQSRSKGLISKKTVSQKNDAVSSKDGIKSQDSCKTHPTTEISTRNKRKHTDVLTGDGPDTWFIHSDLGMPDDPSIIHHVLNGSVRKSKRFKRSPKITNPLHYIKSSFGGNLSLLLDDYRTLTDDNEPVSSEVWEKRVSVDAEALRRVLIAKNSGKLDEVESWTLQANIPKFMPPSQTPPSYAENLLQHSIHYARQRSNLRKFHQSIIKRNSQSIEQYFKRLNGAEDRERKELERQIKQIARKTGQEVMRKWKLAEKIVEQRRQAQLDEEKREKGKEYLNQILDNSAKLIERRITYIDSGGSFTGDEESSGENEDIKDDDEGDEDDENEDDDEDEGDSGDSSVTTNDLEDNALSSAELKRKYENLPDLSDSEISESSSNSSVTDESESESDLEKPSEEALKIYAEIADDEDDEDEGDMEEDNEEDEDSERNTDESDSESESVTGSSASSDSDIEKNTRPNLASLLTGSFNDSDIENSDSENFERENDSRKVTDDEIAIIDNINCNNKIDVNKDASSTDHVITEINKPVHKIDPPFLLRGCLREYQRNGLDWLAGLVQSGTNGILADEMGLGKTIQTIALLTWLACEKHIWGPHLIVVPTSVMLNWELEFKRFAPGLKILTYFGTPQQRKRKRRGWNKEDTWHVCITSYQLVIQDQIVFRGKKWQFMVLDEAHNIKNFRSQRWQALLNFNSQYRLLLTGTPLQNNLVELWSLLYFLMPSSRATQMMPAGFASLDDFQEWFAKPVDQMVEEGDEANEETRATITKLHQVLRPYLLRRLKADVEKQMPGKYEHIVYCRLSKRQRYLYDDFMSRASTRATLESGNFMSILNCLMQLRKVCNHPNLFEVRPIVTSFTIDKGVWTDFGLMSKKFNFKLENQWNVVAKMEKESKLISLRRCELSANYKLEEELSFITKEFMSDQKPDIDVQSVEGWAKFSLYLRRLNRLERIRRQLSLNKANTSYTPLFGTDCIKLLQVFKSPIKGVLSIQEREEIMEDIIDRYAFVTPIAVTLNYPETSLGPIISSQIYSSPLSESAVFHKPQVKLSIAFPDKRLLQYDCGKLQKLSLLLRDLISHGHRCLIFTQMTKVLDILEQFLNLHGWRYLRLDGATRIEQRQALTERFNKDDQIPVFILSTRSGGLGINLTGADTVIFYDSDWNPAMDKQCQDRCHRIGQTRDVHIYRLVSEFTIESNILRKATQKTILDNVVIQEGDFTTDYFNRMSVRDLLGNDAGRGTEVTSLEDLQGDPTQFEAAMAEAEDKDDQLAAHLAITEAQMDQDEFAEPDPNASKSASREGSANGNNTPVQSKENAPMGSTNIASTAELMSPPRQSAHDELSQSETPYSDGNIETEIGHIDDWMIKAVERGILL